MKIAIPYRSFTSYGGIAKYCTELVKALVKTDEVFIMTHEIDTNIPGAKVLKFRDMSNNIRIEYSIGTVRKSLQVHKWLKEFDIDILHTEGGELYGRDVISAQSIYPVYRREVASVDPIRARRMITLPTYYQELFNYKWARRFKRVITNQMHAKKMLIKYYGIPPEKIIIVKYGADCQKFRPDLREKEKVREKYDIENDEYVLLHASSDFKANGLMQIINALPLIKHKVRLLIVGHDDISSYLDRAKQLNVDKKILMVLGRKEIAEFHAASDLFLWPSVHTFFGLTHIEAMASGLPIVGSECANDLITPWKNGVNLKNRNDPSELAECVDKLLDDDNLRKAIGMNARKTAEEYDWQKVASETRKVYKQCLDE